ncbi:MAG: SufD family Fe-S cluster assembly protein [Clostridiales bacterium]|nr:SufD family Fe-S cluster assembly protein [Clostridiales bacterium]
MKNITVNRLPVPTWRYLRFNEKTIEIPEPDPDAVLSVTPNSGEIKTEGMSFADILSELEKKTGGIRRESFVAGKSPIYQEQSLVSGMGHEADELLADASLQVIAQKITVPGQVFETPAAVTAEGYAALYIYAAAGGRSRFIINADKARFLSLKIFAEEGAETEIGISAFGGDGSADLLCDAGAWLGSGAKLTLRQIALGYPRIYAGIGVELAGDRSSFDGSFAYIRSEGEDEDVNYDVIHRGRGSASRFDVKGVLFAGGKKTLRDTIDFRRGTAGSRASEQEDVLLADSAESGVVNRSIPLILCEEEDVDGRHGATIGRIDPDVLVYMSQRGFDAEEAKKLLIRGHIGSVAREIGEDAARFADDYLSRLLDGGGQEAE